MYRHTGAFITQQSKKGIHMSDNKNQTPAVVTVKELASTLQVSERSVRRWIKAGKLPNPSTLGQCAFWLADQLRPFLERRGNR